ncbi:LysR family transcriptional regulator [Sphingomonas naphthae]|uniref:LysR family transcriptional regulator n=1 Tax=Sphingomonas naphthae TaxID=1813468 RepID=A0ABY7TQ83_9SPHN|nr:LysR family transcriptional regulator [Sphingomonas naphthae]WCT75407.1 LysR family transcriptional regulator [Sphingomonas naphthae]
MDAEYALFVAIVDSGSLTAAGRSFGLSPAMVSKRLARLEARLGAQLITRTTRRLATTDVGQTFYDDAVTILAATRAAEARVAGRAETPAGRLRVAAPTSFGRLHIAPHIAGFLAHHPAVRLELEVSDDFVDLVGDRIDLAIRIGPEPEASLASTLLCPSPRVLCAAPAYLAAHGEPQTLLDLDRHALLVASHQTPWRLTGRQRFELLPVDSRVRTNSSEVVRELALSGMGIALRSLWDVSDDLRAGRLVRVLPEWQGDIATSIYAVHPRSTLTSANVRAFVAYLGELYATPPWIAPPTPTPPR